MGFDTDGHLDDAFVPVFGTLCAILAAVDVYSSYSSDWWLIEIALGWWWRLMALFFICMNIAWCLSPLHSKSARDSFYFGNVYFGEKVIAVLAVYALFAVISLMLILGRDQHGWSLLDYIFEWSWRFCLLGYIGVLVLYAVDRLSWKIGFYRPAGVRARAHAPVHDGTPETRQPRPAGPSPEHRSGSEAAMHGAAAAGRFEWMNSILSGLIAGAILLLVEPFVIWLFNAVFGPS